MEKTPNAVTPFTATRYRCPHCRKTGSSRAQMQAHADSCARDPNTRACVTCGLNVAHRIPAPGGFRIEHGCANGVLEPGKTLNLRCPSWQPKAEEA